MHYENGPTYLCGSCGSLNVTARPVLGFVGDFLATEVGADFLAADGVPCRTPPVLGFVTVAFLGAEAGTGFLAARGPFWAVDFLGAEAGGRLVTFSCVGC